MKHRKLRVPDGIAAFVRGLHPMLKKRVRDALQEILNDPSAGKALKDELKGLRSFRLKRFRIIYEVSASSRISNIAIGPRKYIYEETLRLITSGKTER